MKSMFQKLTALFMALCLIAGMTGFPATAYGSELNDAVIVAADKDALTISFAEGDSSDVVTGNLVLPLAGASGSSITWQSDNTDVISTDGTVTRPAADTEDAEVTLTALITYGEAIDTRQFTVLVLKEQFEDITEDNMSEDTGEETKDTVEYIEEDTGDEEQLGASFGLEEMRMLFTMDSEIVWQGTGSIGDPYLVESAQHLNDVHNKIIEYDSNVYFRQTADIDLSDFDNWAPIGNNDMAFYGYYDGDGFKISGLKIDNSLKDSGLFGIVNDGELKNISLINVNVKYSATTGYAWIGALVGRNFGDVVNCHSSGVVESPSGTEEVSIGALIGYNDGIVTGCSGAGTVMAAGPAKAGGLIGDNGGTITGGSSSATVKGGERSYVGGIAGYISFASVEDCVSTGSVTGEGWSSSGGLVGYNYSGTITNSNSSSSVEAGEFAEAGGLVGSNGGPVSSSFCSGSVIGGNGAHIGGLTGSNWSDTSIENCYSSGTVTGGEEATAGGLVGENFGHISACYSIGEVTGGRRSDLGGFAGRNYETIENCFYDSELSGLSDDRGTPKATFDMMQQETFTDWDFEEIWGIEEANTYPWLQWKGVPSVNEKIIMAANTLTWSKIKGTNNSADAVVSDLCLLSSGIFGTQISWQSSKILVAGTDGSINRPSAGQGNCSVTLTATISLEGGTSQNKTFDIVVPAGGVIWQGDGLSADTAYLVETAEHLDDVRYMMGNGVHFKQTANIDLSGYLSWEPIGTYEKPFYGIYDGGGFGISNMLIDNNALSNAGLFGYIENGTLENIRLSLISINITSNACIGGLVGYNNGSVIRNCESSGNINGGEYAGLLVGYSDGDIRGCFSSGTVNVNDTVDYAVAGGLVGENGGFITSSYSNADINVDGQSFEYGCIGGFIGNDYGTVKNCYSTGSVNINDPMDSIYAGGLVGFSYGVLSCYYLDTAYDESGEGEPKADGEMKMQATYVDWDFENTWWIAEGEGYPILRWRSAFADYDSLIWDVIKGYNSDSNNVTTDLSLITSGPNGSEISWSSDDPSVIASNGTITRPSAGSGDKAVVLTAMINMIGGMPQTKEFMMTVKAQPQSGGGSGSGSSNGGGTSALAPVPPTSVDSTGGIIAAPTLDQNTGVAKADIDNTALADAFEKAVENNKGSKVVVIVIPAVKDAKAYESTLPVGTLTSTEARRQFEINTGIATVTLPENMLAQNAVAGANSISLTIAQADVSDIDNEETRDLIGNRPIIQLGLKVDGESYAWSNENVPVTVSIPYQPTAQELAAPEHITVWYIDGSGNVVSVPNGRYDPVTGTVTFNTTHFSHYAVAYVHKTFSDLGSAEWARKPIEVMASKGIINGTGVNNFSPNANITRADYLVLLVKTLGLTAKFDSNFDDAEPGSYYYKALGIAKKLGIAAGSGDNRFVPQENISRQDMIVMTARAMEKSKELKAASDYALLDKFSDRGDIAEYAMSRMATLVREGLIAGSENKLNPRDYTTRAEAAAFLYNIYNK